MKIGALSVFILANTVAIFCLVNPWISDWQTTAIIFFVIEAALLLLVGIPLFLYRLLHQKLSFRRSLVDSLESVLDFITGWV
jgi:hypothetical protein